MKEFLDGELERLASLQTKALRQATEGAPISAQITMAEADKAVGIIATIVEEMEKDGRS